MHVRYNPFPLENLQQKLRALSNSLPVDFQMRGNSWWISDEKLTPVIWQTVEGEILNKNTKTKASMQRMLLPKRSWLQLLPTWNWWKNKIRDPSYHRRKPIIPSLLANQQSKTRLGDRHSVTWSHGLRRQAVADTYDTPPIYRLSLVSRCAAAAAAATFSRRRRRLRLAGDVAVGSLKEGAHMSARGTGNWAGEAPGPIMALRDGPCHRRPIRRSPKS